MYVELIQQRDFSNSVDEKKMREKVFIESIEWSGLFKISVFLFYLF